MLYEGRVRWEGTIDEIHDTTDPIVRQFIEGKAEMEPGEEGHGDAFLRRGGEDDEDEEDAA
jgi:phospholipid/cholesterol/gamma-HCH transport system ATP-binding protein